MSEKDSVGTDGMVGELLIYQTEDGNIKLQARLENETIGLTQQMMAELFQTMIPNISMHIKNIYEEKELLPEATIQDFLTVRREGNRNVDERFGDGGIVRTRYLII